MLTNLAMPTYVNFLSNMILKNVSGNRDASINANISPFPQTIEEILAQQKNNAVWACLFFLQALAFIPSTYIVYIVMERQCKAKHQQIISGVSISAYCNPLDLKNFLLIFIRDKQFCI
jgi:ATP-binding cassette subfamily A (ABC1) protein 3